MIWDSSKTARNIAECHKFSEGEHHILCGDNKILGCLFGKKWWIQISKVMVEMFFSDEKNGDGGNLYSDLDITKTGK